MCFLKKKGLIIALLILFGNIILLVKNGHAKIYKYIDKNGTPCFTDSLSAIPKEYRKNVIEIEEKEQEKPSSYETKPTEGQAIHLVSPDEKKEKPVDQNFFHSNLFKTIIGITGFLFFFIIAGKLAKHIGFGRVATIIRIALTLFLLGYLFNLYEKKIINTFTEIKDQIRGVKEQAEERYEKTNKFIKALDEGTGE